MTGFTLEEVALGEAVGLGVPVAVVRIQRVARNTDEQRHYMVLTPLKAGRVSRAAGALVCGHPTPLGVAHEGADAAVTCRRCIARCAGMRMWGML